LYRENGSLKFFLDFGGSSLPPVPGAGKIIKHGVPALITSLLAPAGTFRFCGDASSALVYTASCRAEMTPQGDCIIFSSNHHSSRCVPPASVGFTTTPPLPKGARSSTAIFSFFSATFCTVRAAGQVTRRDPGRRSRLQSSVSSRSRLLFSAPRSLVSSAIVYW
jgi:hypothetical protein